MDTMGTSSTHRYRRRLVPLSPFATAAFVLGAGCLLLGPASAASRRSAEPLVPLDTAMLTKNMRLWTTDYAVMFYAPWCKHCKEAFLPMWNDVAMELAEQDPKGKTKLVMGKFDCDQDAAATDFCHEIKLQHYPTFMFFGSGKFHDHDPVSGVVLGPRPTEHDSSAKFPSGAMVYHEIMIDWVKAMHVVSGSNRLMEKINVFGGGRKASSEERLVAEIEALERQNLQLQEAMLGGPMGTGEDLSQLPYGYGDPYKELSEVGYDLEFEPVMACVIDMAVQYCDIEGVKDQDPWCKTVESCIVTEFAGDECWPPSCPLSTEGCELASYCLTPELLETYVEFFQEAEDLEEAALTGTDGAVGGLGIGEEGDGEGAETAGASLPPFFGSRRPAASPGGMDRAGDERETVAA